MLSANVLQTNLVSDLPGVAAVQDPNLVNPWGISESPTSPFWIADNNAGVSSLYNTQGQPQTLVVGIPSPGDLMGNSGTPTGTVFNIALAKGAFMITDGTHTAPAVFLFATEDGTIVGWNPGVDPTGKFDGPNGISTHGVLVVNNSAIPTADNGAVYKGLTIATDANGRTLLYASNFRSGKVDVFDTSFHPATGLAANAFTDSHLPDGYAPFDVQVLNGKVYVTYALQNSEKHDDVAGPGHGFVDVYNLDGSPGLAGGKVRLISRGVLNSPWGLAIAPSSFGDLAGSLLVGNFGNGRIHAFDPTTGRFMKTLLDPDGEPIQISGLWALKVGNGHAGGDADKVYFTAGIADESHGLFGSLTPVAPGTPEVSAEAQTVQIAVDVLQIAVNTLIADESNGAPPTLIQQDIQAVNTAFIDLVAAEAQFNADERHDQSDGAKKATLLSGVGHGANLQARDALFSKLASLAHEPG
jgi:uncharacterized protein (TIGR03118 family)